MKTCSNGPASVKTEVMKSITLQFFAVDCLPDICKNDDVKESLKTIIFI